MRNFIKTISSKFTLRSVIVLAIALFAFVVAPIATQAWGPDRPTFTRANPANYVTFNSITDSTPYGDERNFMRVKQVGASNATYGDKATIAAGQEYEILVMYHNNAKSELNAGGTGIAKDAYARAEVPAIVRNGSDATEASAVVGASNANPASVWDEIQFSNKTGGDVALRYIPGSAVIHNNGKTNNQKLADTILTSTGVKLGFDALDGVLPGCNEFAGYITFRVKADQPQFSFKKDVRMNGTREWKDEVTAKKGDKVDYLLSYRNTGTTEQKDVVLKDVLPAGLKYVNGSSKLQNTTHPNGSTVSDGINAGGMNVGSYAAGANAFLAFTATIDTDACGPLVNKAAVETVNGSRTDTATVNVTGDNCKPPAECKPGIPMGDARCTECVDNPKAGDNSCALPVTGPAEVIAGLLAVAAVTIGAVYYYRSRKELKSTLHNLHQ